jgi:hypothetical protein
MCMEDMVICRKKNGNVRGPTKERMPGSVVVSSNGTDAGKFVEVFLGATTPVRTEGFHD